MVQFRFYLYFYTEVGYGLRCLIRSWNPSHDEVTRTVSWGKENVCRIQGKSSSHISGFRIFVKRSRSLICNNEGGQNRREVEIKISKGLRHVLTL